MPELIDTHVHLDDARLIKDLDLILARAREKGVTKMINIGHDMESSRSSVHLARTYGNIWAAVGIHPHSARDAREADFHLLEELAREDKVVAIGEIGLDYHYDFSPRPVQREVFQRQLEMSIRLGLPVVIHQREAVRDTLDILQEYAPLPYGGVMHCFSGTVDIMEQCLELGLVIGLGGTVTFKNARETKAVAAAVPLDKLVLETDCPYLAPHPFRGKVNQPGYLPLVAAEIARLKGVPLDRLIAACAATASNLFQLPA